LVVPDHDEHAGAQIARPLEISHGCASGRLGDRPNVFRK
jgi:hypothetical protein